MAQAWTARAQGVQMLERTPQGLPLHFTWHGRPYPVRAWLNDWVALGDWWDEAGGERHLVAVVVTDRATLTLVQDLDHPDDWWVARMVD